MTDLALKRRSLRSFNVVALAIPAIVLSAVVSNSGLTFASLALLFILIKLFWRPGEPPILLYTMGYQWVQTNILIFFANLQGLPLSAVDESAYVMEATWLTILGLLAVALGLRLGAGKSTGASNSVPVADLAKRLSIGRLFVACLLVIPIANGLAMVAFGLGGLAQPILALANLHWVVVYVFAYTVLAQRKGYASLAVIFGIELVMGFLGFFSDFKTVLIMFLLAALAAPSVFRGIRFQVAVAMVAGTLLLGVVWTGIKLDYRDFLNKGTKDQLVLVPVGARIDKLTELVGELTLEKLVESSEKLMRRLTYVHYFGECIQNVPSQIPYENGKLWGEAITNAVVPRILDPSKARVDDSLRTAHYTGEWVMGVDLSTSVSLGYMAESYIDFGPILMYLPLFLWGLVVGLIYRISIRATPYPLFGYACATVPIFMSASVLEMSNSKMLAGVLLVFLLLYLVQKRIATRLLRILLQDQERFKPEVAGRAIQNVQKWKA